KRRWLLVLQVEQVRPVATGNFQHITKALRGDQRGFGAFAFGERVADHRGTVQYRLDLRQRRFAAPYAFEYATFEIARGGVHFERIKTQNLATKAVSSAFDDVGKGASYVGGQAYACFHTAAFWASARLSA